MRNVRSRGAQTGNLQAARSGAWEIASWPGEGIFCVGLRTLDNGAVLRALRLSVCFVVGEWHGAGSVKPSVVLCCG